MLPLAVLAGVAGASLVPMTAGERRVGRTVIAPAAQSMWRAAVEAGSTWLTGRALIAAADFLTAGESHRRA